MPSLKHAPKQRTLQEIQQVLCTGKLATEVAVGWNVAKDAGLPLKCSHKVNLLTAYLVCYKQCPRQLPQVSEAIHKIPQQVLDWQIIL